MAKGLTGDIPGVPLRLAQRKIRQALGKIYRSYDWSFQDVFSGWLTPGQIANQGTYTTTPYQPTVVADAVATAVLAAYVAPPFLTVMQYRDPARTFYNIIAYDDGTQTNSPNPGFATLTLDRPWMEPTSGPGQPYMIYQCLFPGPVKDFRRFEEIRDTTNARTIDFTSYSQYDLSVIDPQRTCFNDPRFCVPWGVDLRPGTATPGYMLYELWPQQLARVPYSFSGKREGPQLKKDTDTVPYPLSEQLIEYKSSELLYQWKEAQKEKDTERGAGANWPFLAKAASEEYGDELKMIQAIDINLKNDQITRTRLDGIYSGVPYSNRQGGLNLGGYPEGGRW